MSSCTERIFSNSPSSLGDFEPGLPSLWQVLQYLHSPASLPDPRWFFFFFLLLYSWHPFFVAGWPFSDYFFAEARAPFNRFSLAGSRPGGVLYLCVDTVFPLSSLVLPPWPFNRFFFFGFVETDSELKPPPFSPPGLCDPFPPTAISPPQRPFFSLTPMEIYFCFSRWNFHLLSFPHCVVWSPMPEWDTVPSGTSSLALGLILARFLS